MLCSMYGHLRIRISRIRNMTSPQTRPYNFCVIGAGIMGLSSAYCLARRFPGCHIKIIYADCSPDTTSNHSFGGIGLRSLNEFDSPSSPKWAEATLNHCRQICNNNSLLGKEMGINPTDGYCYADESETKKGDVVRPFSKTFRYFYEMEEEEKTKLKLDSSYKNLSIIFERNITADDNIKLYSFGSFILDCHSYLPWMKKEMELMAARGEISSITFTRKCLRNMSEAIDEQCDLVVNCSGLSASFLVPDDKVIPTRGQYLLVRSNGAVKTCFGNHTFIATKPGRIALGSVYQHGRSDKEIDPKDREDIVRRAKIMSPGLVDFEILKEGVGIRPSRLGGPRVELEMFEFSRSSSASIDIPVIHNYGHGSRGILQHWGCAVEVERLCVEYFHKNSKL